jgi:hypothetical protein
MAKKFIITLHDGKTIEVIPTLQDTLAFESTLRKNPGWGKLEHNALKMTPFKCWNAAKRAGLIELTWAEFSSGPTAALDVELAPDAEADDDEQEVEGVGKGSKAAAVTSSSSPSRSALESPTENGEARLAAAPK